MKKGKTMYKTILLLLLLLAICSFIFFIVRYFSFSKYNQYPREEMERILAVTYFKKFTFLKQEYFSNEDYHIWKMYFIDEDGKAFQEYFYMENGDIKVANYKEYGRFWDTYAQLYLEEKYNEEMNLETFRNNADVQEGHIENHYSFTVNTEQEIVVVSERLAKLYESIFSITKDQGLRGFMLNCEVIIKNQETCWFTAYKIEEMLKKDGSRSIESYIENELRNPIRFE